MNIKNRPEGLEVLNQFIDSHNKQAAAGLESFNQFIDRHNKQAAEGLANIALNNAKLRDVLARNTISESIEGVKNARVLPSITIPEKTLLIGLNGFLKARE